MKTSPKLIILAAVILFGTTAAYDFALKTEYEKGTYKDPYKDYKQLGYKNFNSIEINAANAISTEITYSDTFDVKLHKFKADDVQMKQEGSKLIVTFNTKKNYYSGYPDKSLIIKCPFIKEIKADAVVILNGKQVITKQRPKNGYNSYGAINIIGFNQDSLFLVMNNYSKINLKRNTLGYLKAAIGKADSSQSNLDLDRSNKINSANLDIQNNSILTLDDISISNFKYKLSDSSQVNLSGVSLKLITKN